MIISNQTVITPDIADNLEIKARERVAKFLAEGEFTDNDIRFVRAFALPAASGELKVSDALLEKLRRVAQVWDVELKQKEFTSHRAHLIGKLIVTVKKFLFPIIKFFLNDTLRQQRDYNAAVLRCLVEIASDNKNSNKN